MSANAIEDYVNDEDVHFFSDDSDESDGGHQDLEEEDDEEKQLDCFSQYFGFLRSNHQWRPALLAAKLLQ